MSLDWSLVANVASVIGTVGGLLLVWWKVTQLRAVNAYALLRDEVKRFNSLEMRACRARLARTLLASRRDFEKIDADGEEVCGYFEDIGLLLRRRVVPPYFVWSMLCDHISHYWQALREYVLWLRQSTKDQTIYEDFEFLSSRVAALQRKRTGLEVAYSEEELRAFLEDEVAMADGSATAREAWDSNGGRSTPPAVPLRSVALRTPVTGP
jgi:hypothetical protein